jgi:hypothetical protein
VSTDGFHEHRIFHAALDGDATALRQAAGPDAVFCLDPEWDAALLVFTGPDGFQQGNVHLPGSVARLEIPRAFRVRDIDSVDGQFIVTGADGQVIRGTARQFGCGPRLIEERINPGYQDQLAEIFHNTHLLPDPNAYPDAYPAIQDRYSARWSIPGNTATTRRRSSGTAWRWRCRSTAPASTGSPNCCRMPADWSPASPDCTSGQST